MTNDKKKKCICGCQIFEGGETRHHKDCSYYAGSFSRMYDDLREKVSQPAKSNLGCATTRELIEEVRVRIEIDGNLDYRTIDSDSSYDKEIN